MQEQIKAITEKYRGEWNSFYKRFEFPCFYKTTEAQKELQNLLGDNVRVTEGGDTMLPWIMLENFEYDPDHSRQSAGEVPASLAQ